MHIVLKSIKDPARLKWHEVHPERRLNAAEWVKKMDHYYLSIDATTQPMLLKPSHFMTQSHPYFISPLSSGERKRDTVWR
jgi:hypothetical protein